MCEPTTMMVLSIASSVASVVAQQQAADAQAAANQRQYDNTMQAYRANVNQTNLMQQQEREGAYQKIEENSMRARAAQAKARTASGESGISGLSVDSLLGDMEFDRNRYETSVRTNYDRAEGAIRNQRDNVYFNAASQINALKTPEMPDYFGAALRIGNAFGKYKTGFTSASGSSAGVPANFTI